MPPAGLEPETFALVPHTLTQLTKRPGCPAILRIGSLATFPTRSRQRHISLGLSLCGIKSPKLSILNKGSRIKYLELSLLN